MASKEVTKALSIDSLVLDAGTQSRAGISEHVVDDYAEVLAGSKKWPFPPIHVFHDGSRYLVSSGFHRTLAARRHGRASIPCVIFQGTAWDAFLHGIEANRKNPERPNQADKRYMVERLLDSGEKLTQSEIADIVGVTRKTVSRIVAERKAKTDRPDGTLSHKRTNRSTTPDDDDPFDVDGSATLEDDEGGTDSQGEDGRTEADGTDSQERPPGSRGKGKGKPGGAGQRTPAEEFKIQKAKTIKTAEALMRAIGDLNDLRKSPEHKPAYDGCVALIKRVKNW